MYLSAFQLNDSKSTPNTLFVDGASRPRQGRHACQTFLCSKADEAEI
ncbi:hypothetical protein F442_11371 [Phytophthora nicotianae P10297]|uniref:Uncharacterized protein n=3 Tax=Phytophthora nicotianae TaxID=4792 RepID=W2Q1T2_PHYN3|nr:hypothetical protein PPTG_23233 [Phytophthora nicotianae INRA-310]ETK83709.1 hypothetical protein L915_11171 [Phytophthora nicotianae]ETP41534.1 hypothetical protein F442_11371 [Phytophthora nicotianae P10297]ETL37125.1 hypothetical protein L916_11068 [Phytophthora nicotianae]ETM47233.1 hypothetical protein L914_08030 [Phytophthora nicotianae]ETN07153.1 hypothetical protein PPTG_23233 [Phytophthora nicotianae INRA-310]